MKLAARAALMGAAFFAAAATGCAPKRSVAGQASTNCDKAGDDVAAAICADPALQKLDGEISSAMHRARDLYPNDPIAVKAIDDAHAGFVWVRQYAGEPQAVSLSEMMRGERDFFLSLAPAPAGFEGRWVNPQGDLKITKDPSGFSLHALATEQSRGAWVCELKTPASLLNEMLVAAEGSRGAGDPPLEGWVIEGKRQGATLFVKEVAPRADSAMTVALRPYCGMNGGLDGTYFPANPR